MFKRILVAVDGSPTSNRGLKVALQIAQQSGAELHVLHVVNGLVLAHDLSGGFYGAPDYGDQVLESLRQSGKRIVAKAQAMADSMGQPVHTLMAETMLNSVAHEILMQARKLHAELIVLGTHGRRGLMRMVMGSDAEAVLREARVPVLLVRAPGPRTTTRQSKGALASRRARPSSRNAREQRTVFPAVPLP